MVRWSSSWKASKDPGKQRKYRYNAPLHIRKKLLSSHLSKSLREKTGKRSITPRKGDTVRILRGAFKGRQGKIEEVSLKKLKVRIEGIEIRKPDGSIHKPWIDPSNIEIVSMIEDPKRIRRKGDKK